MARLAYLCLTGALGQYWGYSTPRRGRTSRSSTSSYGGYSTGGYSPSYGGYGRSSYGGYGPSYGGYGFAPQPQPRRQVRPQPRPQPRWQIRPQRRQQYYTSWQPQPTPPPPPPPQPTYTPPQPMYRQYSPPAPQEDDGGYFTHTIVSDKTLLSQPTTTRGFQYLGAKTRHWKGQTETRHHEDNQYLGTVTTRHQGEWSAPTEKSRASDWKQISDTGYGPGKLIKRAGASKNKDPTFGGFSDNIGWTIRTGPAQAQQAAYQPEPVQQARSYQPAPAYGDYQAAEPVEEYSEPAYGAPSYGAQVEEPPAQYDAPASYGGYSE